MRNKLLASLEKPLITEAQQNELLAKVQKRSMFIAVLVWALKSILTVIAALVLFYILVLVGHYSGVEDFFRGLLGVK